MSNATTAPPLGEIRLLHQAKTGQTGCFYCQLPMGEWKPNQECPGRGAERIAFKAADEYYMNTRNTYFTDKPNELRRVLVSIILGAHALINEQERENQ